MDSGERSLCFGCPRHKAHQELSNELLKERWKTHHLCVKCDKRHAYLKTFDPPKHISYKKQAQKPKTVKKKQRWLTVNERARKVGYPDITTAIKTLKEKGYSHSMIAKELNIGKSSVAKYNPLQYKSRASVFDKQAEKMGFSNFSKAIVVLHEVDGKEFKDIAKIFKCNGSTVSKRYKKYYGG